MSKIEKTKPQINQKDFWHPTEEHKKKFYDMMEEMTEMKEESIFEFHGKKKVIAPHQYYIDTLNGREKAMSRYGAVSLIGEETNKFQIAIISRELYERFDLLENMYFRKQKSLFQNTK